MIPLWYQLKGAREPRTDSDCSEIAMISREDPVHLPPFGNRDHCSINESHLEILEPGVELKRPNDIDGKREFVFVASSGVEDFRDELAHGPTVVAKKVVHLRQNEPRKDDPRR